MSIPAHAPSTATPSIQVVWEKVYARFGSRVSSLGVFVCKYIAGTTTWSQHSWGNAWDIGGDTAVLNAVAAYARSDALRGAVSQVLWQVPDHYNHVHISGRPLRTGTPACASDGAPPSYTTPSETAPRLPTTGELVAFESWAPAAREASRELVRRADRIARVPEVLGRIIGKG